MEKTNGQFLGTDASQNKNCPRHNKNVNNIIPSINGHGFRFNPDTSSFSRVHAVLVDTSPTVTNGHCFFDAMHQAFLLIHRENLDTAQQFTYMHLRQSIAHWAINNPLILIEHGDITQLSYLQAHLGLEHLSVQDYNNWWLNVTQTDCYAETPVLMAASIFMSMRIFIWRRKSIEDTCLSLATIMEASFFNQPFQAHVLLDADVDTVLDQTAHFSLLTEFSYKLKGTGYASGTPPYDFRFPQTGVVDNPAELDSELATSPSFILPDANLYAPTDKGNAPLKSNCPPSPTLTLPNRFRQRCSAVSCHLIVPSEALRLGQQLCGNCLIAKTAGPTIIAHPTTTILPQQSQNNYGRAWTDGGCRDVCVVNKGTKKKQQLLSVGGWGILLLCGRGFKFVASASLGPNSTNNIAEFTAVKKVITLAVQQKLTQLDIHTDSGLAVQYSEGTCIQESVPLRELWSETVAIATQGGLQFKLKPVKAHSNDINNNLVDSMCTAVIQVNDMIPRYSGPTPIGKFTNTDNCARPRSGPNIQANYRTYAPYEPLFDDVTPARGVADLSDDRGNLLHICPFCDADPCKPNVLANRKALLCHLRGQHRNEERTIPDDIRQLFGISLCGGCVLYYATASIKEHNCRQGIAHKAPVLRKNTPIKPTRPKAPAPPRVNQLMTRPSQISEELVDRLTAISFDEIFQFPAVTIMEIHHSSVKMWAQALSLTLDGILTYAFGGLSDVTTSVKAEAFLKLFLMAPRLLLSSTRGVAARAKLLLTGTQEAFEFLLEQTIPKLKENRFANRSEAQQNARTQHKISELIKNCDLSRALNALEDSAPLIITAELNQKIVDLHPAAAEEHRIPGSAPTRIRVGANESLFQEQDLARVIKDLRTHAAPDMTGLRPSHIKCLFRGRREQDSPEATCRVFLYRLIHSTLENPTRLGPTEFWENFDGGKLTVIPQAKKPRPVGQKNLIYKLITSINGRKHDKALVELAGPAHLAGKPNGVLAAALMTQMELDYMQRRVELDPNDIRVILTTDAEAAFQSTSRKHCYDVLCSEPTLRDRFAPFFAHTHMGAQRVYWPAAKILLTPSSGFTQGDVNSSKLFTCNTASLVAGLQAASPVDATVVAIVDDITIMGKLNAVVDIECARDRLQKPANYLVNTSKQYVYTMIEAQMEHIQLALPNHTVVYVGNEYGFNISGIPLGGEAYITAKLQKNLDKTKQVIANISKLDNVQDKLILLLVCIPGRIQHLLGAVPINLSRHFAHEHDEAITTAVADALDLGPLTKRDKLLMQRKLSNHGLGLRSMEANLEFLFLAGFMKTVKSITSAFPHFNPTLASTLEGESGYGLQLTEALNTLKQTHSQKLLDLLPDSIADVMKEDYNWPHDAIQRELDNILSEKHDSLYNMDRIGDQQDKATLLSTDTSIFTLIPRSELLRIPNEHLVYFAKQLFGKPQRKNVCKFCPNISSKGEFCGAPLDSRDLHIRTCKMNPIHHQKHAAVQHWFEQLAKQAHIATTPAPPISETNSQNPTKPLAADLLLIDVSLKEPGRDGQTVAIDFSVVSPAAESYCKQSAKEPLHAAALREATKISKYARAYKEMDNIHFEPFVLESGGAFGERARHVFNRICNLITQSSGQSGSAIAYFWKSRLLVTLAAITFENALKWAKGHNQSCNPDSVTSDLMDYFDHDEKEQKRMRNSSGLVRLYNSTDSGDDTDAEEVAAAAEVMEEDKD